MEYVHYIPAVTAALVPVITNAAAYFSICKDIQRGVARSKIRDDYTTCGSLSRAFHKLLFDAGYRLSMGNSHQKLATSDPEKQYI